jgi:hypothetical protein
MKHVMIDTETLATTADACILSIGAVKFDLDSEAVDDNGFYASISVDSNLELKRRISEDTLIWWMAQGPAAQGVFHESKQTLRTALEEFADWLAASDIHVWSNGGDFDLPILAHAFVQCGMEVPWKFWNSHCFRTYKNLPGAKAIRSPVTGVKHNALSDAHQQVVTLQAIHKALFVGKPHAMVKT